jgi:hypothetical protein
MLPDSQQGKYVLFRGVLLPRSLDAGQNPGAQKHYCPHHNPMQRQMYYNGAVSETGNHNQESNDVNYERHVSSSFTLCRGARSLD